MAIEVLLRRSIEGVGQVGQVVRVKNGYARNYLLPYQLAALPTPDALRHIEKDKAAEAVRDAEDAKARTALAERLAGVEVRIEARAGEDGHLYGSVGARQVIDALKRMGLRFEERQVRFETVRELGEYEVPIHLSREHFVKVKLWVVLDAEDAKAHAESAQQRASEEAAMARFASQQPAPVAAPVPVAEGVPGAPVAEPDAAARAAAKAERAAERAAKRGGKTEGDAAPASAKAEKAEKPEKGAKAEKAPKGEKPAKGEKKKSGKG